MKIIAVMTENFAVYYDLVKALKSQEITFISLTFTDLVPPTVGVVITTEAESEKVEFQNKILIDNELPELETTIQNVINEALKRLGGKIRYEILNKN